MIILGNIAKFFLVNVRSSATIEINLLNPLTTKEAVYNVIVQGDGLEGDATATGIIDRFWQIFHS